MQEKEARRQHASHHHDLPLPLSLSLPRHQANECERQNWVSNSEKMEIAILTIVVHSTPADGSERGAASQRGHPFKD